MRSPTRSSASASPISPRTFSPATSSPPKRCSPFTRPKSRNGGRSSRLRISRRSKALLLLPPKRGEGRDEGGGPRVRASRKAESSHEHEAFDKIAEGLLDAIAITKGKADPAAYQVHAPARFGQSEPVEPARHHEQGERKLSP